MPSKPPISKAKKAANRTAKKLPTHIAKRFKKKAHKEQKEEEMWNKVVKQRRGEIEDTQTEQIPLLPASCEEPLLTADSATLLRTGTAPDKIPSLPSVSKVKGRRKGVTNRLLKAAMRDKLVV